MSKIFLTSFEPWRRRKRNTSLEILKNVNKKNIYDFDSLVLPTIFGDLNSEIRYIKNSAPDYVLCLGECTKKKIQLEKKAKNLITCISDGKNIPDNNGKIIQNEKIIAIGSPFYITTLPYRSIIRYVRKQGYDIHESSNAGGHVCNFLFYKLLHEFNNSKTKVGFMHFPHSGNVNKFTELTCLIIDYLNEYSGGKEK